MNHQLLFAASLAIITVAGCNKEAEPDADTTTRVAASDTAAPAAAERAETPGQSFANVAAASDVFEIETSKLAIEKASTAKIKTFARQMVKAHTETTTKLKTASAAATPPIAPVVALTAAQQTQLDDLRGKSGAEFDRAYVAAQITAHQATLDSLKGYSAGGNVHSLKTFATDLIPVVTAHLNMAKSL